MRDVEDPYCFVHRARAARRALSLRCSGVILAARAFPPFKPPLRPNSTAAAFLVSSGGVSSAPPVARSTISFPSWFGSRGRLRERSGIARRVAVRSRVIYDRSASNMSLKPLTIKQKPTVNATGRVVAMPAATPSLAAHAR